jgi:hypothetical protein
MGYIKYQEGGAMPQQEQPQGQEQGGGMEQQIMQLAEQLTQQLPPEGIMMLIDILTQMVQGGGQEAPQEAPTEPQPEAPAFRRGGKINKKMYR